MNFNYEQNKIFASDEEGHCIAKITFPEVHKGVVDINHTFVDVSLRGQGIASKLVEAAYFEIKKQGLKATVSCPYVVDWFEKHSEYQDILIK